MGPGADAAHRPLQLLHAASQPASAAAAWKMPWPGLGAPFLLGKGRTGGSRWQQVGDPGQAPRGGSQGFPEPRADRPGDPHSLGGGSVLQGAGVRLHVQDTASSLHTYSGSETEGGCGGQRGGEEEGGEGTAAPQALPSTLGRRLSSVLGGGFPAGDGGPRRTPALTSPLQAAPEPEIV